LDFLNGRFSEVVDGIDCCRPHIGEFGEMKTNYAVPFIWFILLIGFATIWLPDSSFRDSLFAMQFAALLCAGYAYWKFLKRH
jgi:hypothetical protein